MSSHAERYKPHPYKVRNAHHTHKEEQQAQGLNQRIAIAITNGLGSTPCMYFFVILAIIGFPGLHATPQMYVQWLSQTFIQLVALSVLGIAQNILNRQGEIQSDAMYETDVKTHHDVELILEQNNEQMELIKRQSQIIEMLHQELSKQTAMLNTALTPRRRPMKQEVRRDD